MPWEDVGEHTTENQQGILSFFPQRQTIPSQSKDVLIGLPDGAVSSGTKRVQIGTDLNNSSSCQLLLPIRLLRKMPYIYDGDPTDDERSDDSPDGATGDSGRETVLLIDPDLIER